MTEKTAATTDRLLSVAHAAHLLGVAKGTLANWRSMGMGPPFIRLNGGRAVRYRLSDLLAYLETHTISPTE